MEDFQSRWRHREGPEIQGILILPVRYFPVSVSSDILESVTYHFEVKVGREIKLQNEEFDFVPCDIFSEIKVPGGFGVCGDGTQGGDGYVALENENRDLIWIAFFQNSNPFMKVSLEDNCLHAISEYGVGWILPLDEPQALRISNPKPPR